MTWFFVCLTYGYALFLLLRALGRHGDLFRLVLAGCVWIWITLFWISFAIGRVTA